MYFQDIYSNLWKVNVFIGNIYSLILNTYFWGTVMFAQDGFLYLTVTKHKLTVYHTEGQATVLETHSLSRLLEAGAAFQDIVRSEPLRIQSCSYPCWNIALWARIRRWSSLHVYASPAVITDHTLLWFGSSQEMCFPSTDLWTDS
jgi:hypothetical protein